MAGGRMPHGGRQGPPRQRNQQSHGGPQQQHMAAYPPHMQASQASQVSVDSTCQFFSFSLVC